MSAEEFSPADFQDWWKDPRGEPFWNTVQELLKERRHDIRFKIRQEKHYQASIIEGFVQGLEEVLDIPEQLIEENEKKEKK